MTSNRCVSQDLPSPAQLSVCRRAADIHWLRQHGGIRSTPLLDALIHAVAGRRALLYPGWSGLEELSIPDNFCVIVDTPHDWLFPRTSVVIHHGGSGTTHSAVPAGVPSIVLPFAGDQFFWAEQLQVLGVAPAAPSGRKIDANSLSRALAVTQTTQMRDRAATLGAAVRSENGLATAVDKIQTLLARH